MGYPQASEAKVTNRTLLQGLKAWLGQAKGYWVDKLHYVLWAYQTTQRILTGEIPFSLAFGTEAIISMEIRLPSFRVEEYNEDTNSKLLRANLDLLEEHRECFAMRIVSYHQRMAQYYNAQVKAKEL